MNLDQNIVEEILLRLPARSLCRFRSVCKSWSALIKSSRFIDQHHAHQRAICNDRIIIKSFNKAENKHVVSYYTDYESLRFLISPPEQVQIPGNYPTPGWSPFLAGEVNGIVCLKDVFTITLMNPALREFRLLPTLPYCRNRTEFDRPYRAIGLGFGFDESRNDYKVVILDFDGVPHIQFGAIYSVRSNCWRELGKIPLLESYYINDTDLAYLFFNGCVHWYATSQRYAGKKDMIITFNMTTESFREMQPPQAQDQQDDDSRYNMLFVVDKSLMKFVSITKEFDCFNCFLNIWVMKEYGMADSWTKEYRIQVISTIGKPLSFWKNDKLLCNTRSTSNETELICYDLPTGEVHRLRQFDCYGDYDRSIGLVVFNESLVSLDNI